MEREQIGGRRVRDNNVPPGQKRQMAGRQHPSGFSMSGKKLYGEEKIRKAFYLEEEEKEAETLRLIFREFLNSHSLTKTAQRLTEKKIFTRRGRAYTPETIGEILENPVYCQSGELSYNYFASFGLPYGFPREEASEEKWPDPIWKDRFLQIPGPGDSPTGVDHCPGGTQRG